MNYYDVLGIPKDCEQPIIEHIYKSLVKIYHPDLFKGDKIFAEEKLKAINEAYFTLENAERRKTYDAELSRGQSSSSADEIYDDEWSEYDTFSESIAQDWRLATSYFPDIDSFRLELVRINKTLAFFFQIELIVTKRFRDASEIFSRIRKEYLTSKFGDDMDLHNLVLSAINTDNRKFALDLNKALVVLGKDEFLIVMFRLINQYPDFCGKYYTSKKFKSLLSKSRSMGLEPGKYRVGKKVFGVTADYRAYLENRSYGGVWREECDSVQDLINSGSVLEAEIMSADKII